MTSQIFKNLIPIEVFNNFLNDISLKIDDKYVINHNCFKRGIYNEIIQKFIENCKEFYYLSKRKYIERKLTYSSFLTIIRQICNSHKITYTSQIKYDKSTYEIVYYITKIPVSNQNPSVT